MPSNGADAGIVRELAKQYAEIAAKPVQDERRKLWADHFSLKGSRPPVLINYGIWNVWCKDVFGEHTLKCEDPFFRTHERWLRMQIFHDTLGDDHICEPWLPQWSKRIMPGGIYGEAWGAKFEKTYSDDHDGSWISKPSLQSWGDLAKLQPPIHGIDEEATARDVARIEEAAGDILPINVDRTPVLWIFGADISTTVAPLRGFQQIMVDMFESPNELHELLAFLRDGILANQQQAEDAGHLDLANQHNQAMTYAHELEQPIADSGPRKRKDIWGFCAAQEYTLISPEFHKEFLFDYQKPIMEHFGLVHYGCCEDLTQKIDMLRELKNLRSIAVAPAADLAKCAEQIGPDYAISWRPSPAEMVCTIWDPDYVRKTVRNALEVCHGCHMHVSLKDVETLRGDVSRLPNWVRLVREEIDAF